MKNPGRFFLVNLNILRDVLIDIYKELALSHRYLLQSVQLQTTGQGYDVYNGTLQDKSRKKTVFNPIYCLQCNFRGVEW